MTQTSKPLILTRPKPQSLVTLEEVVMRLGRRPETIIDPLVKIEPCPITLPSQMKEPFIFTSRNAVDFTSRGTHHRGQAICVGLKVTEFAQQAGFDVIYSFQTVDDLITFGVPKSGSYLRGKQVSADLQDHSPDLQDYILYEQLPLNLNETTIKRIETGAIVPVYSENAARRLIEMISNDCSKTSFVCISDKVATTLSLNINGKFVVSEQPTSVSMIKILAEQY